MIPQERRDSRSDQIQNNRPRGDFAGQSGSANAQAVNVVFREPVQKVLKKVRNEPFKWLNKMAGDLVNRNQKPVLPLSSGSWTHYRRLQKFMGSFGTISLRKEVKASLASLQWPRRPSELGVSGKCCAETFSRHHKRHICYSREDRILSFQDNVSILLLR